MHGNRASVHGRPREDLLVWAGSEDDRLPEGSRPDESLRAHTLSASGGDPAVAAADLAAAQGAESLARASVHGNGFARAPAALLGSPHE
ncbi:hypothetical protein [Streptomyces sp. B21-083]|uniref:hypothetical protein n=1 Tax=Streptomyces sp. B21-083 TaxID=3039410 RepID=UPI003FA69624